LSIYFDTSFLVGLFVDSDSFASNARAFYVSADELFIVSDFAVAEFASAVARLTRMGRILEDDARAAFSGFDTWRTSSTEVEDVDGADIRAATAIIRRLDLNIRAPDAINLAIAIRLDASIATFDRRMTENARALGLTVAAI
jgi:predicted nucleic acid-binding protein